MYEYRVTEVIRVVDGDTVDLRLDLGFHLSTALRFRILGLDTPERGQPGWAEATEYTRVYLATFPQPLKVRTEKADSFGRWLADVYPSAPNFESLTEHVIRVMTNLHGIDCRWKG
jgi:micrococcal nuclease